MKKRSFRPSIEGLETRCVPTTARLSDHVLSIKGTHGNDHIAILLSHGNIKVSGVSHAFHASTITKLAIYGVAGHDVITIDKHIPLRVTMAATTGKETVYAGGGHVTVLGRSAVAVLHNPTGFGLLDSPVNFAAINISSYEQYMLELINRARANPTAEANRYGITLNEGIPTTTAAKLHRSTPGQVLSSGAISGPISSAPKQPLAINASLYRAAVEHSQDMLSRDYFDHPTLGTGVTPQQRDIADGYDAYYTGENIGWGGTTGTLNQVQSVADQHQNLFVDKTEPGRGHRINMMNPDFNEVGVGIGFGRFTAQGQTYNAVMVTQDFGAGKRVYLTGVMYHDANGNKFYDVGEGRQGVTIKATSLTTGQVYTTTTGTSGGYQMPLPAGTYSVTWPGMTGAARKVTLGTQNVKLDMLV